MSSNQEDELGTLVDGKLILQVLLYVGTHSQLIMCWTYRESINKT